MPSDELDSTLAAATRQLSRTLKDSLRSDFLFEVRAWLDVWSRRREKVTQAIEQCEKDLSLIDEILHDATLQRREERVGATDQEWILIQAIRRDKSLIPRDEQTQQSLDDELRKVTHLRDKAEEQLRGLSDRGRELDSERRGFVDDVTTRFEIYSRDRAREHLRRFAGSLDREVTVRAIVDQVVTPLLPWMSEIFDLLEVREKASVWKADFGTSIASELQRIEDEKILEEGLAAVPNDRRNESALNLEVEPDPVVKEEAGAAAPEMTDKNLGEASSEPRIPDDKIVEMGLPTEGESRADRAEKTSQQPDAHAASQPQTETLFAAAGDTRELARTLPASILQRILSSPERKALRILIEHVTSGDPEKRETEKVLETADAMVSISGIRSEAERNRVGARVRGSVPKGWKARIGEQPSLVEYWKKGTDKEKKAISTYIYDVKRDREQKLAADSRPRLVS